MVYLNRLDASVRFTTEPRKVSFGPIKGGCVRLAPAAPVLAIAEGIEDALSFMQATGTPSWAAISDTGIRNFVPPPLSQTHTIVLLEDQDENQVGQKATGKAARKLARAGYKVQIARPVTGMTDTVESKAPPIQQNNFTLTPDEQVVNIARFLIALIAPP